MCITEYCNTAGIETFKNDGSNKKRNSYNKSKIMSNKEKQNDREKKSKFHQGLIVSPCIACKTKCFVIKIVGLSLPVLEDLVLLYHRTQFKSHALRTFALLSKLVLDSSSSSSLSPSPQNYSAAR